MSRVTNVCAPPAFLLTAPFEPVEATPEGDSSDCGENVADAIAPPPRVEAVSLDSPSDAEGNEEVDHDSIFLDVKCPNTRMISRLYPCARQALGQRLGCRENACAGDDVTYQRYGATQLNPDQDLVGDTELNPDHGYATVLRAQDLVGDSQTKAEG